MRICCIGKIIVLDMKTTHNNSNVNREKKTFFTLLRPQLRILGLIFLFIGATIQLGAKLMDKKIPEYTSLLFVVGFGLFLIHRWVAKK
jgi:hypothetical protein